MENTSPSLETESSASSGKKTRAKAGRPKTKAASSQSTLAAIVTSDIRQAFEKTLRPGEAISERLVGLVKADIVERKQALTMTSGQHKPPAKTVEERLDELTQQVAEYNRYTENLEKNFRQIVLAMNANWQLLQAKFNIKPVK